MDEALLLAGEGGVCSRLPLDKCMRAPRAVPVMWLIFCSTASEFMQYHKLRGGLWGQSIQLGDQQLCSEDYKLEENNDNHDNHSN